MTHNCLYVYNTKCNITHYNQKYWKNTFFTVFEQKNHTFSLIFLEFTRLCHDLCTLPVLKCYFLKYPKCTSPYIEIERIPRHKWWHNGGFLKFLSLFSSIFSHLIAECGTFQIFEVRSYLNMTISIFFVFFHLIMAIHNFSKGSQHASTNFVF